MNKPDLIHKFNATLTAIILFIAAATYNKVDKHEERISAVEGKVGILQDRSNRESSGSSPIFIPKIEAILPKNILTAIDEKLYH